MKRKKTAPSAPSELLQQLLGQGRLPATPAKTANKLANQQNRWQRFNHYVWDKRKD
ncbi:MAG: hypothetical protein ACYC2R_14500 [Burkholderiales bacterium]